MTAIISLTTIPSRIEHIGPALASLVAQGLPVYLWAVEKIARSPVTLKRVPEFPGVNVEVVEDRGPITKLLPALERGFDTVIVCDDDHTYGPGWAAGLLAAAERHPDAAVGYRGRVFGAGRRYNGSRVVTGTTGEVDMFTNVSGVCYRSTFFGPSLFEEWRQWPMNDDIVICGHLRKRGVKRLVVPFPRGCKVARLAIRYVEPLAAWNVGGIKRKATHNDEGLRRMYW